jgi:large subunit ribosomal protein L22
VRMSARKARVVLEHVRGRTVPEARTVLAFTPRAAAREVEKVLGSAVANAESAYALDGDELVIEAAYADEGPTLKRWRPRARGRVNRINKRTCHITVVLRAAEGVSAPPKRRAAVPTQTEAPLPVEEETAAVEEPVEEAGEAAPKAKRRSPAKKKEAAV